MDFESISAFFLFQNELGVGENRKCLSNIPYRSRKNRKVRTQNRSRSFYRKNHRRVHSGTVSEMVVRKFYNEVDKNGNITISPYKKFYPGDAYVKKLCNRKVRRYRQHDGIGDEKEEILLSSGGAYRKVADYSWSIA